ncbi:MAG: leucyl aminopeptidase [Planctomycetaceae bacterium]
MRFHAQGAPGAAHPTDAFVLFRGKAAQDRARLPVPDPALRAAAAAARKEFAGERGETLLLHGGAKGRRLLLVGLGDATKPDLELFRTSAAAAARVLDARGLGRATFLVPSGGEGPARAAAIAEGIGLALYRFDRLQKKKKPQKLQSASIAPEARREEGFASAVTRAQATVEAVAFARDLGNLPPNIATPSYLAARAQELAGPRLRVRVHNRAALRRLRMGAFLAVAQGSDTEPRLVEMHYRGGGARAPAVALVGKGVTFDTGGISIKPAQSMEEMKFDMCGAAAVFGAMHALRALRPKINVSAYVPAADNMPSGNAYRPSDIVRARDGTTIEIISTDAEGRMLLCDTIVYAAEKKPDCIVDLATLTGACVVALGDAACGLFGNDTKLSQELEEAGARSGEIPWPLPILPPHEKAVQSAYADLKNSGGRSAGACTAAAFLKHFAGKARWAHLDIAGTAWGDRDEGYRRKGATGFGVRLLLEFLLGRAEAR